VTLSAMLGVGGRWCRRRSMLRYRRMDRLLRLWESIWSSFFRKLADSHPSPLSLSVQEPAEDVAEGEGGVPAGGVPPRWCQETTCGWT
jgi:hypothetical protein